VVVKMHAPKSQLSRLVARAEAGEEILIARNGKPAAKFVSAASSLPVRRVGGSMRGQIHIALRFDDPDPCDHVLIARAPVLGLPIAIADRQFAAMRSFSRLRASSGA
jgi:prevent-host-death family protein